MSDLPQPRRLVQIMDVDADGRRWPVLVTGDPRVIASTERAVRELVHRQVGAEVDPAPPEAER